MLSGDSSRFVVAIVLTFVVWFGLVGWTQFRRGGHGVRFLALTAGLCAACLGLCLATSWAWAVIAR